MQRLSILVESKRGKNSQAFLFPLFVFQNLLKREGIRFSVFSQISETFWDGDIVLITSRFAKEQGWWRPESKNKMWQFLDLCREKGKKIIWVDLLDSAGTTHLEVLSKVDLYWKGSVLKSKARYLETFYGNRVYTDFYHKEFNVTDDDPGEAHLNFKPAIDDLKKIRLSWNQAFLNYGRFAKLYHNVTEKYAWFPKFYFTRWISPKTTKDILCHCRMKSIFPRKTVAFQRQEVLKRIEAGEQGERVGEYFYFRELKRAATVLSPFGWGEINFRDFEALVSGAALIKPDCGHLETWPDLFQPYETYLPFAWDFSDLKEKIESISDKRKELEAMAKRGQQIYRYHLFHPKGKEAFVHRVQTLLV